MELGLNRYDEGSVQVMTTPIRSVTLQERLDLAMREAEARLAEAKEAREIFQRNPDLERLLNIMQKGRF